MTGTTQAVINLEALKHNLSRVKQLSPDSKVVSVIKANAYGHGVLAVAEALNKTDCYGVARLDEAVFLKEGLRKSKPEKDIIILEGVYTKEEFLKCVALKLVPVIHCLEQFQCLLDSIILNDLTLNYWLKVDTGMHRLGLSENDLNVVINKLHALDSQYLPSAFISHFACADDIDHPLNNIQITNFNEQINGLCKHNEINHIAKSMANSAAILSMPGAHFDWVRPGIMLYGASPFETAVPPRCGADEQLKPVMTLSSELIAIKKLKKGDCVGYGASWCCSEDMKIGVIAIGYGDGYPRHASSGTPVLIHKTEVPLVGRVSMDKITVDLRALEEKSIVCQIGDKVILWGDDLPIERVSQKSGTIAYELLCQITQRVCFNYE